VSIIRTIQVSEAGWEAACRLLRRAPCVTDPSLERAVREIVEDVRERGEAALLDLGRRFDCPALSSLEVPHEEIERGSAEVPAAVRDALAFAADRIRSFHEKQAKTSWFDPDAARLCGQIVRPMERVGIYVPGGTAVYPSSVLMVALPARAAGVSEIVMCSPCGKDGRLHPAVLFAARLAGVNRLFKIGGAQAVAAMAFGAGPVPAVDKIAGPGNVYVNAAKRLLWGVTDMDMLAGPSEVCVVADESANPAFVAADLLTQAEHDAESAAFLLTPSASLAAEVEKEIGSRLPALPRRSMLEQALGTNSAIVVTENLDQAFELANQCAPEHLALMVENPMVHAGRIRNAGAILLGDYSPQTLGDYLAGPSHTLPTSGAARYASPVNVETFLKRTSLIGWTKQALEEVSPHLYALAAEEGFAAHAEGVRTRLG
jgi:histidinol dehydrogenase